MPSRSPRAGTAVILIAVALLSVVGLRAGAWTGASGVGLGVSLACWLARGAVDPAPVRFPGRTRALVSAGLLIVSILVGGAVLSGSSGVSAVPAIAGIVGVFSRSWIPLPASLGISGVAVAELLIEFWDRSTPVQLLLAVMGMALAASVGWMRRQREEGVRAHERMLRQELRMREDAGRAELARELHDLLAHGLGGLVTQLDAAGALLEAGQQERAADRIETCRRLASDSLREAREAVAALRRTDTATRLPADALLQAARAVVEAAVGRGENVKAELRAADTGSMLPSTLVAAFTRILQEALSNARDHAPGRPVHVGLLATDESVELTVRNPLAAADNSAGIRGEHGFGLVGMRERLAELSPPGELSVSSEDEFTLTARARIPVAVKA